MRSGRFRICSCRAPPRYQPSHVDLFDGILISLVPRTEIEARSELAERLSTLANAPPLLVRQLVRDDEARIAGPLLRRSPLIDEPTLVEIARIKSQLHLLAIAERPTLSTPITDVIVRRGDRDVVRKRGRQRRRAVLRRPAIRG